MQHDVRRSRVRVPAGRIACIASALLLAALSPVFAQQPVPPGQEEARPPSSSAAATARRPAGLRAGRPRAFGAGATQTPPPVPLSISGVTTVGLMTGALNGTFIQIGSDIAAVTESDALRVVPLVGKGSLQNLGDLFNLRGVDLALVAADAARYAETHKMYPGLSGRVSYIAKLYDQEVNIIAGADIRSLADLAGKAVNADVVGSGTFVTASALFETLNIPAKITNDTPDAGVEKLRRGEVAAVIYVIGKPGRLFSKLPENAGLHMVPIPPSDALLQTYLPASLTHDDYPNLIPPGETVETLATPVLLTAYNWPANSPRYQSLAAFTDLLFSRFAELLRPPFHAKWRDVNLRASVPGWTRAPYAQQWLDREDARAPVAQVASRPEEAEFAAWVAANGLTGISAGQRLQLLELWKLRQRGPSGR